MSREPAQGRDRVRAMHQDEAADDRVEGLAEIEGREIGGDEVDVVEAPALRAGAGFRHRVGSPVEAEHGAVRPHHLRRDEGDVAGAAADIEDAHPRPKTRLAQELPREGLQYAGLVGGAFELPVRLAENVVGYRGRHGHLRQSGIAVR